MASGAGRPTPRQNVGGGAAGTHGTLKGASVPVTSERSQWDHALQRPEGFSTAPLRGVVGPTDKLYAVP